MDTPNTTNGCESFHRHLKDHIGAAHPNVFKLATVLLQRQELTYIKLQGLSAIKPVGLTSRQQKIKETCDQLLDSKLSFCEYIQTLSFKFLPAVLKCIYQIY